jgi:hypothetical protein
MSKRLETVIINRKGERVIINKTDFVDGEMDLWVEKKSTKKVEPVKEKKVKPVEDTEVPKKRAWPDKKVK